MRDPRSDLLQVAEDALRRLGQAGAASAIVRAEASTTLSVDKGDEPHTDVGQTFYSIYARASDGRRTAHGTTSEGTIAGIEQLVRLILSNLSDSEEHDAASIPESLDRPPVDSDLQLFDASLADLTAAEAEALAAAAKNAASQYDKRVATPLCTVRRSIRTIAIASSAGMRGAFTVSRGGQLALCVARDPLTRGEFVAAEASGVCERSALRDPSELGTTTARNAVSGLGGRPLDRSVEVPVIFDSRMASIWLSTFGEWVCGDALLNRSSYLSGRLGTTIASPLVSIVDDALIRGAVGSRPFDADGLPSRRNVLVRRGILESYLLDTYSANRLGLSPTASARGDNLGRRSAASNLSLENGATTAESIVRDMRRGMLVKFFENTRPDPKTGILYLRLWGDWIENGETAYALSRVSCSITMDEMLRGIDALANDRPVHALSASPSFRVSSMTLIAD